MSADLVNWEFAASTASRLVSPGPKVTLAEAREAVSELRRLASEAEGHVRSFTQLSSDADHDPVVVVDRIGWVTANVGGFRILLEPLMAKMGEKRSLRRPDGIAGVMVGAVGSRVTGAQMGVVLAYLAGKVLGQYELFVPPSPGGRTSRGRLSLVAPNIVATERVLDADPRDFRLWVCVHEVTHRTQFTAVPWLGQHVRDEISAFLLAGDLDAGALLGRFREVAEAIVDTVRGGDGPSLVEAVQTPEQRVVLERLTAIMTLLEGHGEYVMNHVGTDVIPSVEEISKAFAARRRATGPADRMVRRLFGLDLKAKQYAEGAAFVAAVVEARGMAAFNRVWTSPNTLPTRSEIADPQLWITRVLGAPVLP